MELRYFCGSSLATAETRGKTEPGGNGSPRKLLFLAWESERQLEGEGPGGTKPSSVTVVTLGPHGFARQMPPAHPSASPAAPSTEELRARLPPPPRPGVKMKVLLAKLLCLVGVFVLMLGGSLLPVKVLQADPEKARRSQRLLSLCNAFGGGVFLATCFNALLPAVRHKFQEVSQQLGHVATDYPVAETLMVAGFFLTVFVEQLVLTCRKERPSFIDLETFNAGSDLGSSDSEHESPFLEHSWGHGHGPLHGEHGHPDLGVQELTRSGPLRLASLVLALSAHSVFEGLALGLQEEGSKVVSLFLGVAVHESLVAVALGVNMAKAGLSLREAAKVAVAVSLMIPLGIGLGLGIESARNVASAVASVLLQGLAGGTFLFVTFLEILAKELEGKRDRLLRVLSLVVGYAALAGLVFFKW
ncbi:hypothetical protein JRQ81_008663 [Phrynocephalus forsythii]|uniref:Zinc transporter ZIP3 n=1 Tax=Phrynocephalus forsythii TaxID=171643 RepID=A0A9Q1ASV7_9SAUR|nr:hypothetical protein JRQ81_008663 [Phrynocephalus forsythii]